MELTLNGRSIGNRRLADAAEGVLIWQIPFEPGVLRAVGICNGRPAGEFVLQTAGAPSRLALHPDVTELRADGKDICHSEFRIVDSRGVHVPDAELPVTLEVDGPAELLAAGNGDLNSTEDCRDAVHRTYQGRGLAILRTRAAAGKISVKGTAPGVAGAEVTLIAR